MLGFATKKDIERLEGNLAAIGLSLGVLRESLDFFEARTKGSYRSLSARMDKAVFLTERVGELRKDLESLTEEVARLKSGADVSIAKHMDAKVCSECGVLFKDWAPRLLGPFSFLGMAVKNDKPVCPHCRPAHDEKEALARFAKGNPDKVRPLYEAYLKEEEAKMEK